MPKVDQFESVFRSAVKERFVYDRTPIESILVVTDLGDTSALAYQESVKQFLRVLDDSAPRWRTLTGDDYDSVQSLLDAVGEEPADLICTYRHLKGDGWRYSYSLGDLTAVLTQATRTPVLVLPHPEAGRASGHAMTDTRVVMAMTDHLTGDHRLVNWALRLTEPGGRLFMTHVADAIHFEFIMDAIGKIPEIDTDLARELIARQLLKEPRDYIASCRAVLAERFGEGETPVTIESIVRFGHRLREYEALIEQHEVDLLVLNTKDEDQLAMHGLAYPLAVELRQIPLLML